MRALITVAHYYEHGSGNLHGSQSGDAEGRAAALFRCIANLYQLFGDRQGLILPPERIVRPANEAMQMDIDIVICTSRGNHLLNRIPGWMYRHHPSSVDPRLLGYECHTILRDAVGDYDWYCFMEDDILLTDPLHFWKLQWFNDLTENQAVLQPNRFERAILTPLHRLYIDGNLVDTEMSARFQDVTDQPRIEAEALGRKVIFQRIDNPHAGCFFLNEAQMSNWAGQSYFLDRESGFWGPLESAATLGIMRTFRTYKAARENASFFEVEHAHTGYLGARLKFGDEPPHRF